MGYTPPPAPPHATALPRYHHYRHNYRHHSFIRHNYRHHYRSFPCADVNAKDTFGKTPLHNAILGKHVTIVDLLLKSGADVKCLDERGDTPLHNAVRVDSEAIVVVSF